MDINKMNDKNKEMCSNSIDTLNQSWEESLRGEFIGWQTEGMADMDEPHMVNYPHTVISTIDELLMNDRKGCVEENTPYYIIDIDLVLKKLYGRWHLVNDGDAPEVSINTDIQQLPNIKGTVYKVKELDKLLINVGTSYRMI